MRLLLIVVGLYSLSLDAFCTAQYPDYLIYRGDTIALFSNPLESYLKRNGIDSIPNFKSCSSTACWRGYIAVWEIKNDSLFLVQIRNCDPNFCDSDDKEANLNLLFKNVSEGKVYADWVKETLISPQGRQIKYVHMGYQSIYEREFHFKISRGKLIDIKHIENDFENTEQIDNYNHNLILDSIFAYVKEGTNWEIMGGEEFCDDAYYIKIGKSGKVKSVVYEPIDGDNFIQRILWNLGNRECIKAVKDPLRGVNFKSMITNEYFKPLIIRFDIFYRKDQGLQLESYSHWETNYVDIE